MSKETLKLALEALETCTPEDTSTGHVIYAWHDEELVNKAIKALEEALAKQECVYNNDISEERVDETHKNVHEQEQGELAATERQVEILTDELANCQRALEKQEQGGWHTHDLYTDADKDRPDVICDSNGQVALRLCKRCGRGEAELETPCDKAKQNQGEPVACLHRLVDVTNPVVKSGYMCMDCGAVFRAYVESPQQRTWVGLTEQEAAECWSTSTIRTWQAIEAKLKEKNT